MTLLLLAMILILGKHSVSYDYMVYTMPGSYGKEGTPLVILKVIVGQYYVMFSDKTLTPNCVCVGGGGGGRVT